MKYFKQYDHYLEAEFEFQNFRKALDFINLIWNIAEIHDHHPDISLFNYKFIKVSITTHDAENTLTKKDFALAKNIELSYKK